MLPENDRLFEPIGPELTDEEKIARLKAGEERCYARERAHAWETDWNGYTLSPADEEAVRSCLTETSPAVRAKAVHIVAHFGDATWDDFRRWFLDPDKNVRGEAMSALDMSTGFTDSDKEQYVSLLEESWMAYPEDVGPGVSMSMKATHEDGWLETTWRAAERLLDLGNEKISESLTCGYFEDVIGKTEADDPHIRSWIEGRNKARKEILLGIAAWLGCKQSNLRAIVEALTSDVDAEVAEHARGILARAPKPRK